MRWPCLPSTPSTRPPRPAHSARRWPDGCRRLARPVAGALLALALLGAAGARADGRGDHDQARAAMLAGEVMPLPALLERLQRTHPGQVLELELERDDGRWIYEVRLLQRGGQLVRLDVDARTAEVLRVRRKSDASAR